MYRTIDCATWDDPWFAELSPHAKLLFLYFITNRRTSAAGCFEITRRAMMFESGIRGEGLDLALDELKDRVTWWPELQVVFVRNFYKHQRANSNKENFRKSAVKALAEFPEAVRQSVTDAYPDLCDVEVSHTEPIPIPSPTHGYKETVTVTETDTEQIQKVGADAQKPVLKAMPRNGPAQSIVAAWYACAGGAPVNYAKAVGLGQKLADLGCTEGEVAELYDWMGEQEFFQGKWDMGTAVTQFEKFRQSKKPRRRTGAGSGIPA
jgi:hypothetical protein